MHGSDRESEAQKFQAKLSYLAPGPNNDSTHAMVFEDVWLHSHRLLGFSYTGQSPVEHEIVLRFVTPGS